MRPNHYTFLLRKTIVITTLLITCLSSFGQEKFLQHSSDGDIIHSINAGDIDNDGDIDFLTSEKHWLENVNGNQHFKLKNSDTGSPYITTLLIDIDLDGDQDIVYNTSSTLEVNKNDGSGRFTQTETFINIGSNFLLVKDGLVDVDNDNDIDIIFTTANSYKIAVNNNDGTFEIKDLGIEGNNVYEIFRFDDWNNDNFTDITVYNHPNDGDLSILLNDGANNFNNTIAIVENQTPIDFYNYIVSDYDQDGDLDIISNVSKSYEPLDRMHMYKNDGAFNFTNEPLTNETTTSFIHYFKVHDVDGDLDLDVVITMKDSNNYDLSKLYWIENNGQLTSNFHLLSDLFGGDEIGFANIDDEPSEEIIVLNKCQRTLSAFNYNNGEVTNTIIHGTASRQECSSGPTGYIMQHAVDYNNDNQMDYIAVNRTGISLHTNTGQNSFEGKHLYRFKENFAPKNDDRIKILFTDYDLDGDIDITYIPGVSKIVLLENNNNQTFEQHIIYNAPESIGNLTLGDIDNDGDEDLVFLSVYTSGQTKTIHWLQNEGNGVFNQAVLLNFENPVRNIQLFDVDTDGQLDIVLAEAVPFEGYQFFWHKNDNLNFTKNLIISGYDEDWVSFVPGDLEGDGDTDFVWGIRGEIWLLINDGTNTFTKSDTVYESLYQIDSGQVSLKLVDIDNDNDLDMVRSEGQITVWENNNNIFTKEFSSQHSNPIANSYPVFTDYDNDADQDFFLLSELGIRYFENTHTSTVFHEDFSGLHIDDKHLNVTNADYFDIDNDGDIDVIGYSSFKETLAWYENDGAENFTRHDIDIENPYVVGPSSIKVADFDGDGDGDLIIYDDVFRNDNGNFIKVVENIVWTNNNYGNGASYNTADIDNDGDQDVLYINANRLVLLENEGNFSFRERNYTPGSKSKAQFLDVDKDGLLDLVCMNSSFQKSILWYKNNGGWNFTENVIPTQQSGFRPDYEMGDLNNDGFNDFIFLLNDKISGLINDGSFNFLPAEILNDSYPYSKIRDLKAIDMNMDGATDIALAYEDKLSPSYNFKDHLSVMINNGDGTSFEEFLINSFGSEIKDIVTVDLDDDGDEDIISSDSRLGDIVWYKNEAFVSSELNLNTIISQNISCTGNTDGVITSEISGGQAPYFFDLLINGFVLVSTNDNGQFTNLAPGSYQVDVTDSNGTTANSNQIIITAPPALLVSINTTNPSCFSNDDGQITVTATGGSGQYLYSLNGIDFFPSNTFSSLASTSYTLTVKDSNDCSIEQIFNIDAPEVLLLTISSENSSCPNANDGTATALVQGGSGDYSFTLNGVFKNDSTTYISLENGIHTLEVQDSNGCIITQDFEIESSNECDDFTLPVDNFTIEITNESCASANNASILIKANENLNYTATLSGNNAILSDDFSTFTSFQNLMTGDYEVCLTVAGKSDYKKCFEVQISEPEALQVDSKIDDSGKSITIKMQGATRYNIVLNETTYTTTNSEITLALNQSNNNLVIKTDKGCQGKYQDRFIIYQGIHIYPNPVQSGNLHIEFDDKTKTTVRLSLYTMNGTLIQQKFQEPSDGRLSLNINAIPSGVYSLTIATELTSYTRRIIKN